MAITEIAEVFTPTIRGTQMRQIEPMLHIGDIKKIFGVSQATVYRWLAEARAGKNSLPLPLNGYKRKLLWNAADVEAFCQTKIQRMPEGIIANTQ